MSLPLKVNFSPRLSKNEVCFRSIELFSILLRQISICLHLLRSVYSFFYKFKCPMLDCRNATSVDNKKSMSVWSWDSTRATSKGRLQKMSRYIIVMKTTTTSRASIECSTITEMPTAPILSEVFRFLHTPSRGVKTSRRPAHLTAYSYVCAGYFPAKKKKKKKGFFFFFLNIFHLSI